MLRSKTKHDGCKYELFNKGNIVYTCGPDCSDSSFILYYLQGANNRANKLGRNRLSGRDRASVCSYVTV